MAFQRFIGQRAGASSPKISLLPNGVIEFNEPATRKFALTRFNYALIYYDPDTREVGIRFINNAGEQGAARIIKKPNGLAIPAANFLKQHGLLRNRRAAYDMTYSGEHDMYIIQLSPEVAQPAQSAERKRAQKPKSG